MSALHIGFDHNFIEHSRRVFEEYYPNTNTFVILKENRRIENNQTSREFCYFESL